MFAFLQSLGLERYYQTFADAEVDLGTLPLLSDADLVELGLPLGPRRKLRNALDKTTISAAAKDAKTPASEGQAAERRHMTILFVNLFGADELTSSTDPEMLREVIASYRAMVTESVAQHQGYVAQYLVDGILCYFGWPQSHEDDAERAVRTALNIVQRAQKLDGAVDAPLQSQIGVATGTVIVGDLLKDANTQRAVVVGETPNLAARLQAMAAPDQIVISPNTREILGDLFDVLPLGAQSLKGIEQPVAPFAVLRERPSVSRFGTRTAGAQSELVGRESESAQIAAKWREACAGHGQLLLVTGAAGIGKSRLVQEAITALEGTDYTRVTCQCSPYHTESPFYPLIQTITRAAQFDPSDHDAARLSRLLDLPGVQDQDLPLLGSLLGIEPTSDAPLPSVSPARLRVMLLDMLVRLTLAQARSAPVLFVFEDLHWIDPTSLELVEALLDRIDTERILILATTRPEFGARLSDHPAVSQLFLNRLDARHIADMIGGLADKKAVPPALIKTIAQRTDGVPLFVEELTKSILESGSLVEQDGRLILSGEPDDTAIPNTLHDSLMARLDRRNTLKEVAQLASCIGREFEFSLLASIFPHGADELRAALDGLIEAELVYRRGAYPDERYLFKHALVRDAAYDSLLKERRRALHASLLKSLEQRADIPLDVLARHADAAGEDGRALELWEAASKAAIARPAFEEAISHLRRAMAILESRMADDTPELLEKALGLQVQLSVAILTRWGYGSDEATRAFQYALSIAERVGNPPLRFAVQYGLWVGEYVRAEYAGALARARVMVEDARHSPESAHLVLAHRLVGVNLCLTGELAPALDSLNASLALFDPEEHDGLAARYGQDIGVATHCYLMYCHGLMGKTRLAQQHEATALARAEQVSHANTFGYVYAHLGYFALIQNDMQALAQYSGLLNAVAREHELDLWKDTGAAFAAILRVQSDTVQGVADFLAADAKYRSKNALAQLPILRVRCAEQALLAGDNANSVKLAASAQALIASHGERYPLAELRRVEAAQRSAEGDTRGAEQALRSALEIARDQSAGLWELRAANDLAALLAPQGALDAALPALTRAMSQIAPGDCDADMKIARQFAGAAQ